MLPADFHPIAFLRIDCNNLLHKHFPGLIVSNLIMAHLFVSLADEESVKQILADTVLRLWETVNNLTRLRPSKRGVIA